MRVVIYGVGKGLCNHIDEICWDDVCCLVDSCVTKQQTLFCNKEIILPEQLSKYKFDYIVISSDLYFQEIAENLVVNYGERIDKIISLRYYLWLNSNQTGIYFCFTELARAIINIAEKYNQKRILDIGLNILRETCWYDKNRLEIDGLAMTEKKSYYHKYYNSIINDFDKIDNKYNFAVILHPQDYYVKNIHENILEIADSIMVLADGNILEESHKDRGIQIANVDGILFGFIRKEKKNINIYEVTHKKFVPVDQEEYLPICVGEMDGTEYGYLKDSIGDSISSYNRFINECTALYWMWKNGQAEWIGLNHYRRFFKSEVCPFWPLQSWELQLLSDCEKVYVATAAYWKDYTVPEVVEMSVTQEAFEESWQAITEIFSQMTSKECDTFKYVMSGHIFFPCQMFIMKRHMLEQYCTWLFPILFEMIERVKIEDEWDAYSKRIIGFWAERLLTVWIALNDIETKQLSILLVGDGRPYGKD